MMIINRERPHLNPITFVSCTDATDQVEWMKKLEEKAPFCSESDDYDEELKEVRGDQGESFPYSKGLYLICLLTAAMHPHDLGNLRSLHYQTGLLTFHWQTPSFGV